MSSHTDTPCYTDPRAPGSPVTGDPAIVAIPYPDEPQIKGQLCTVVKVDDRGVRVPWYVELESGTRTWVIGLGTVGA